MKEKRSFFGTDGIRGHVGGYPITADFILKLGWAVGTALKTQHGAKVLIGKDTRVSGYMIESALEAGLSAAGSQIYILGPIPTSAIAYLTRTLRADAGIVISASHNAYDDNGIKFFSSDGYKLPGSFEQKIEELLEHDIVTGNSKLLGKAWRVHDAQGRYIEFCKSSVPHQTNLKGFKIVIDCANGATYHIAPYVFRELGADVIETHVTPDGFNINERCGSMHPEVIANYVLQTKADLGIAFDGDGDRVIMVDHLGQILDGDELLYIIAKGLLAANRFLGGIVGTCMTNMGLELAFKKLAIPFIRVPVGDQHVIEALIKNKWMLGGEPSGHIVNLHATTTADGIITALQVLYTMQICEKKLAELTDGMQKFPQYIANVSHHGCIIALDDPGIQKAVKKAEERLKHHGRLLLRYSGTEPLLRIMVEGDDEPLIKSVLDDLVSVMTNQFKSE